SGWASDPGSASDTGSDSEGGGGEAAARFREAAWDCVAQAAAAARVEPRGVTCKESHCFLPSGRGASGAGELQTTPEFRAHVAKRLGAMLDSFITVSKDSSGPSRTLVPQSEAADDGFRLFSSSVPGDCGEPEPRPAARRRQPVSSSDTDSDQEWQRYQEAAVSAADILKQSAFPALSVLPGAVKKKKKKKKE
ncbi:CSTOS protein, partial [Serilophus lunatus]|nr:CSTOS protein [Serilophus lunatus]